MKKVIYGALFLALVGIGFSSCEKEELRTNTEISKTSNTESIARSTLVGSEISYIPTSEELSDQLVLALLGNTVAGNPSVEYYEDSENDPLPEEGIWMMEATANYLTNGNLLNTSSDEIFQMEISVDNYLAAGDIIRMNDADMYLKFDQMYDLVNGHANEIGKKPKLVDFKFTEITEAETALQVYVVYGDDIIVSATWPTTNAYTWDAADELENKITWSLYGQLFQQYVGNAMNGNYSVNGSNPYFANVDILTQVIDAMDQSNNLAFYGCPTNDCLWGNIPTGFNPQVVHPYFTPNASNDRLFPASAYPTYYNRGKTLVENNYNQTPPISSALGVFGCNYNWNGIVGPTDSWHQIIEIYAGIYHVM